MLVTIFEVCSFKGFNLIKNNENINILISTSFFFDLFSKAINTIDEKRKRKTTRRKREKLK